MAEVLHGRHTAQIEGSFVVFLIGMRINKVWKVRQWLPAFMLSMGANGGRAVARLPATDQLVRRGGADPKDLGFGRPWILVPVL